MQELQQIRKLAAALRENLAKCAVDPDVDPVHDTRTGTRRLQATIENLVRSIAEDGAGGKVRKEAAAMLRLLKRIRRAAGPVRDLDVHRKLLHKLAKQTLDPEEARKHSEDRPGADLLAGAAALEAPQAGLLTPPFEKQAGDLDAWLKGRRDTLAKELQASAVASLPKFDKRLTALERALPANGLRRRKTKPLAVAALESFARLATEMQALHAGNLHDFRKGAKKARYVAELAASGDREAARVGETLKKLQDEIGDWHDWLVLADEARAALGDGPAELVELIQAERDQHFAVAMQMAGKLRGRLMGEWLAVGRPQTGRQRTGQRKGGHSVRPGAAHVGQARLRAG
jgi:CHAD domain-containing protein